MRVKRGTLEAEREGRRLYILLTPDPTTDPTPTRTDELISELRDRVRSLEEQMQEEREANRENRRIIAALTSRIPQIEAPQEPSESPSEATEQPGRVGPQTEVEGAQEPRESSGMHMPVGPVVVPCPMTSRDPQSAPGGVGCSVAEAKERVAPTQEPYFIYLVVCVPVGIYKIGYARDPEARTRELERLALGPARYRYGLSWQDKVEPWQSASCQPYRLLWYAPANDYRAAERTLHERFADKRIKVEGWRGPEWFTLNDADIDYIRSIAYFERGIAIPREEHARYG